jgi:hypothetical protein
MTIEYEMTKEDLSAFSLYHNRHSPIARRQYLRSWLVPPFIWLLLFIVIWHLADQGRGKPLQTFLDLLPLFSFVPIYLLYFPWAYRRKLRKIVGGMVSEGHNRGLLDHHRVTISPENITDSNELGQTTRAWRGVEKVAVTDEHAFIYIHALAAVTVPRRAFASPLEFDEFVRAAKAYHGKASQ